LKKHLTHRLLDALSQGGVAVSSVVIKVEGIIDDCCRRKGEVEERRPTKKSIF
jgi:hypothetical protein